jgi:uncharacterized protein YbcV (DUF1398 family)
MTTNWKDLARATLEGSESGAMTFPQSLRILMEASFDGYAVDLRRSTRTLVPGYTYKGFCAKVAGAGCAGYMVSLLGRRVLYYGRTGETHTEYFPGTQPAAKF